MQNRILRLSLLAIASITAIFLGFSFFSPEKSKSLFTLFGYANIAILFTVFAVYCTKDTILLLKQTEKHKKTGLILICALIAATFLYTREGGGFKVMFDEHVLSNVAISLYKDHEPSIRESTLMGVAHYENIDKRPLLFPFVLSLVHNIIGYKVANAFLLNFVLTTVFLILLYSILKRVADHTAGLFSCALACTMPLIEQNSSGGGFEMLNLCGALTCAWLAMNYRENSTERNLTKLVLAAALASHIRYESAIIILPVAIIILLSWIREKRIILPYSLILLPISFLTLAWQFNYINSQSNYWQYNLKGASSFSISYLGENLTHAFRFFAIPDSMYAGSPFVGIIGIAGLLGIIGFSLTRYNKFYDNRPDRTAALAIASALVLQFLLVLCFTFGQLDIAIVSRLGLPFVLLLIACGGILLSHIYKQGPRLRIATIVAITLSALYSFTMYSKSDYTNKSSINARVEAVLDFAKTKRNENNLYISKMPRPFELEGFNNLSTGHARVVLEDIKRQLDIMTYDNIYLIELGIIEDIEDRVVKSIIASSQLGAGVELETEFEHSTIEHNFFRISRILSIDPTLSAVPTKTTESSVNGFKELTLEEYNQWRINLP